jgi:ribonucleoside-diphosphate reductase alpha chain
MAVPSMVDLHFTPNAMMVFNSRYLRQDDDGHAIETPHECFHRVSTAIAASEPESTRSTWSAAFCEIMANFDFLPAGRTLSIAGTGSPLVSNCVVLHIEDSLDRIFETMEDAALLHQAGSGVGFPFHLMRPAGFTCKRTLGVSSGPVSFLGIYSSAFRPLITHGRESANMALLRVDHPDILEFLTAKTAEGRFPNFNCSIALTDEFMEAATARPDEPWLCQWETVRMKPRAILRHPDGLCKVTDVDITSGELFDRIVNCAWQNGEPGCVFLDTVNRSNPLPGLGRIECCNPCGEQYLHDGDACNLGSINLERFVKDRAIDKARLAKVTKIAVRFLDDVIDQTNFPVKRVQSTFLGNRRIGIGIMGLADMLFALGLAYDSEDGRNAAREAMKCIQTAAIEESEMLGLEKGSFPNFGKSIWTAKTAMRNASLTNVAPTGSVSMLFDVSSGIEPYFALAYRRENCLDGREMELFVNKHLKAALENCSLDAAVWERIIQSGSVRGIAEVPDEIRRVFVTSLDIAAEDHCLMQAAVQEFCCNAISKTINFPLSASVEDVKRVFVLGWRSGVKGMTVYRNGSRGRQVLVTNEEGAVRTSDDGCTSGTCDL